MAFCSPKNLGLQLLNGLAWRRFLCVSGESPYITWDTQKYPSVSMRVSLHHGCFLVAIHVLKIQYIEIHHGRWLHLK